MSPLARAALAAMLAADDAVERAQAASYAAQRAYQVALRMPVGQP